MAAIEFQEVASPAQIAEVARLGGEIWREHYGGLLSAEQIAYMLEKYQSERAVAAQLADGGYRYWLVFEDGRPCGYCGFVREEERLFLSKLYLRRAVRGRGIARLALEKLRAEAAGLRSIYLTVNKENSGSIAVYKALGFREIDAVKTDIGGGFYMDDYIMELPLC